MTNKSAVVLVIDGLSARFLGPYANAWFGTEQFDRLAGQSMLAEFAFTDSTDLLGSYQSLWGLEPKFSGLHEPTSDSLPENELFKRLGQQNIGSTLFTDDAELGECESLVKQFDRVICNPSAAAETAAKSDGQTELATFFASALDHTSRLAPGEIIWLHSKGLSGSWDAPYPLRCQFAADEDPDPPEFVTPPRDESDAGGLDPDELLGYQQACAAQIVLLDRFLGILLDQLESIPAAERPFFVLTSTRGFPLGTNRFVGQPENSLYDDATQVPLFAQWPDQRNAMQRNQSLIYSSAVGPLLLDWFGLAAVAENKWIESPLAEREHEFILSATGSGRALRTHGWKLIVEGDDDQRLFVKPDDRWDMNDVIRKCRNVGQELAELAQTIESEIQTQGQPALRKLPEELAVNWQ